MMSLGRLRHRATVFLHDLLVVPLAWLGAFWLRFNLESIPPPFWDQALTLLPVILLLQAAVFWWLGLYRGIWRFASLPDLSRIAKAVFVGTLLSAGILMLLTRFEDVPRSVPPLYAVLLLLLLGGPRYLYRLLKDARLVRRETKRVMIVGAGSAGEALVRELHRHGERGLQPVAFVDDDRCTWGKEIQGVRVVGGIDQLPRLAARARADLIVIAIPSASGPAMRRIVGACERSAVPFRTLPCAHNGNLDQVSMHALREVAIEDLLGRAPVVLDWNALTGHITGKVVAVSGGGGSIGAELCRQLALLSPERLIIIDQSEYNLYRIELELREEFPELALAGHLADIRDNVAVSRLLERHRPEVIYHAAAYKHVPLLESQAREVVRNNVLGTRNLAEAAVRFGCSKFILISTDKAVKPTSIMGASKRIAEMLCTSLNGRSDTRFITVRFGNVLGSAGSVVPLFRRQIERGGPVTVTHPDVTRYFMTVSEACQLIMQAGAAGHGGEVFVLDMGDPVSIRYLAEQMIILSGKTPGTDIQVVYKGLRPGEKLAEELFHEQEITEPTGHDKILLARPPELPETGRVSLLPELETACAHHDDRRLLSAIAGLVPDYTPGPLLHTRNIHRGARGSDASMEAYSVAIGPRDPTDEPTAENTAIVLG